MKTLSGLILILAFTACSRQEPAAPPPVTPSPPPASSAVTPVPVVKAASPSPAPDVLLKAGADLFATTCATCHMADGSGVPWLQPSIKGSAWISAADPQLLLSLILRGSAVLGEAAQAYENDMAPQDHLSDAEIAAVATYVRSRFAAPPLSIPVTPAEVTVARNRPGLP